MDMSGLFAEYIEGEENYRIAYDIVRRNSVGRIWLAGGALSRNLNQLIHGTEQHSFDFDFVVEALIGHDSSKDYSGEHSGEPGSKGNIEVPEGWVAKKNKSGYLRFVKGDIEIDIIPLKEAGFIVEKGLEPSIENFLSGVPFTIQVLAYDCEEKKIIGDKGIEAFENKVFEVNDLESARKLAEKKGVELNDLILKKAESMGFVGKLV